MSEEIDLPSYFPVSSALSREFESLKDNSSASSELNETQAQILKAANAYFETLFPSDANVQWNVEDSGNIEVIKSLLESFEKLSKAQQQTKYYNTAFKDARDEIRQRLRSEPELTLANIDTYKEMGTSRKTFSQILEDKIENPPDFSVNSSDADFIFLKNATFVIDHPLDPLPDEEEDDDLQIGGGKIDLKCPVSMNLFESPMVSKKCGHTIDQQSIFGVWPRANQSKGCPILGCSSSLMRSDFVPDRLMALRVKSYKAQQKRLENSEEYDRLE